MPIRVISGSAKGRYLKMVPGDTTRPIMDKVKEALFNILGSGIIDSSFLDLFAGTGSVGIEALSRGAGRVQFIDKSPNAIRTIHENLRITSLTDRADVLRSDALVYLRKFAAEPFEYIYVAPPQYMGLWKETLLLLDTSRVALVPDGIVIAQIDPAEKETLALKHLQLYDERQYGKTTLLFFEMPADVHGTSNGEDAEGRGVQQDFES